MTLCGWKIFSKGKQKVKQTKVVDTSRSVLDGVGNGNDSRATLHVTTTVSASGYVPGDSQISASHLKGESPSLTRVVTEDACSWDDGDWTVDGGKEDDVDGGKEGNPRNKCSLKPGHSLMDWIRLGSSGLDLTGTKGVITAVSHAELAKHCKQDDAWLAIRGKVYNVTHYMGFHPGGPDELMKGIGKDATKLFEDVHAWVNYEQLLAKCYVGPLRNSAIVDLEPFKPLTKTSSDNSGSFRIPTLPFLQTSSAKTSPIKSAATASRDYILKAEENTEVIPRFDWIQKTSDLTLIFYTRALCNPGLIVTYKSGSNVEVRIQIERTTHVYNFELSYDVNYPCVIKVSHETGKIEMRFTKSQPQLWTNYGAMEKKKLTDFENMQMEFEIVNRESTTPDAYALVLQSLNRVIIFNPIGYHVSLTTSIDGAEITRSYTPIPVQYFPLPVTTPNIPLLVKSYETGTLSSHLSTSKCTALNISQPKGNFTLTSLKEHTSIGLLAAGSGITPILAVLQYLLDRTSNRVEKVLLLLFNKTEQDIWCRHLLEKTAEKDSRLVIRHILSEPQADWHGETGRISTELITPLAATKSQSFVTYCCICGPTPFNELSEKLFKENGFTTERLHFFHG